MDKKAAISNIEAIRRSVKSHELIGALQDCVAGNRELSAQQVRAAEILLKKSLPDLSAVTLDSADPAGFLVRWQS